MVESQFNGVSVIKEAKVSFDGRCISRDVLFDDGKKKMLVVVLPGIEDLNFETHTSEKIEIISGECEVRIAGEKEFKRYHKGKLIYINGNTSFALKTDTVLDYVCHLEG